MGGRGSLLGPVLAVVGCSWASAGCPRSLLGPIWSKNTKNMATLNMCSFFKRECDLRPRGRSCAALGPSVGGLGPLLGPTLALLGRSWGLCWRPWGVLGPKRSVLGLYKWLVLGRVRAEKWPKPVLKRGPKKVKRPRPPEARNRYMHSFYRYIQILRYVGLHSGQHIKPLTLSK